MTSTAGYYIHYFLNIDREKRNKKEKMIKNGKHSSCQ